MRACNHPLHFCKTRPLDEKFIEIAKDDHFSKSSRNQIHSHTSFKALRFITFQHNSSFANITVIGKGPGTPKSIRSGRIVPVRDYSIDQDLGLIYIRKNKRMQRVLALQITGYIQHDRLLHDQLTPKALWHLFSFYLTILACIRYVRVSRIFPIFASTT